MHVIIVGCGRVGSDLARSLSATGHSVAVVDKNPSAFERLAKGFDGLKVEGIGFDKAVLIKAGVEHADSLAAVTNGDNTNIVSAMVARRHFQVPRVVARLYDPVRAAIYQRLGVPTVSPTTWGAKKIQDIICHEELHTALSFGNGEVEMVELEVPAALDGLRVADITIPGGIQVASLMRGGEAQLPTSGIRFQKGDLLHVIVTNASKSQLRKMVHLE